MATTTALISLIWTAKRRILLMLVFLSIPPCLLAENDNDRFIESVIAYNDANAISADLPDIREQSVAQKQQAEMIALMEKSISSGKLVADGFLDELHPQLREYFRDYLIQGQVKYLEGINEEDPAKQASAIERLMVWAKFWNAKKPPIMDKLHFEKNSLQKSRFWRFAIILFVGYICFGLGYPVVNFLFMFLVLLVARIFPRIKDGWVFLTPFMALNLYFWAFWAAFLAALAIKYSGIPGVSHGWLYFGLACLGCLLPTNFKGGSPAAPALSDKMVLRAVVIHLIFVAEVFVAFIVFCVWPGLAAWPYGWLLKLSV